MAAANDWILKDRCSAWLTTGLAYPLGNSPKHRLMGVRYHLDVMVVLAFASSTFTSVSVSAKGIRAMLR